MQESVTKDEDARLMLVGLIVQDRLEGAETERLTVPEKPDAGVIAMVEVPLVPVVNVTVDGVETVKVETDTAIDRL